MNSSYLKRFDFLTHGPIAELACLSKPKEPVNEQKMHFPEKLSTNSSRDRICEHCSQGARGSLISHSCRHTTCSIFQTSSLLKYRVAMSHSNHCHPLNNSTFTFTMLQKCQLPVYDQIDLPTISLSLCVEQHDFYAGHEFVSCKQHNKITTHNFLCDC